MNPKSIVVHINGVMSGDGWRVKAMASMNARSRSDGMRRVGRGAGLSRIVAKSVRNAAHAFACAACCSGNARTSRQMLAKALSAAGGFSRQDWVNSLAWAGTTLRDSNRSIQIMHSA